MDRAQRQAQAAQALEQVGLAGWGDSYPDELSGGMQQRVGLARALASDPSILLMDEAFSALDPIIRTEMQSELLRLQKVRRRTIVSISHDLDEAMRIGDRIAITERRAVVQWVRPTTSCATPPTTMCAVSSAVWTRLPCSRLPTSPESPHRGGRACRPGLARGVGEDAARTKDREYIMWSHYTQQFLGWCRQSRRSALAETRGGHWGWHMPACQRCSPSWRTDPSASCLFWPPPVRRRHTVVVQPDGRFGGANVSKTTLFKFQTGTPRQCRLSARFSISADALMCPKPPRHSVLKDHWNHVRSTVEKNPCQRAPSNAHDRRRRAAATARRHRRQTTRGHPDAANARA